MLASGIFPVKGCLICFLFFTDLLECAWYGSMLIAWIQQHKVVHLMYSLHIVQQARFVQLASIESAHRPFPPRPAPVSIPPSSPRTQRQHQPLPKKLTTVLPNSPSFQVPQSLPLVPNDISENDQTGVKVAAGTSDNMVVA